MLEEEKLKRKEDKNNKAAAATASKEEAKRTANVPTADASEEEVRGGKYKNQEKDVVGAYVIPEGYGVGNHHLFVLDFLTSSMIGQTPQRIIRSSARRLNTKILSTKDNYTNVLGNLVLSHRLTERMVAAHNAS